MIFNINFSFLLPKQQKTSHLQMNQIPKRKKKIICWSYRFQAEDKWCKSLNIFKRFAKEPLGVW